MCVPAFLILCTALNVPLLRRQHFTSVQTFRSRICPYAYVLAGRGQMKSWDLFICPCHRVLRPWHIVSQLYLAPRQRESSESGVEPH